MTNSVISFHQQLIEENGIDHATGFSPRSQQERFDVFLHRSRKSLFNQSVLDFGCATGDFHAYQRNLPYPMRYTGVDINPQFIERARARFPATPFVQGSVTDESVFTRFGQQGMFDYTFSSGAFCYAATQPDHIECLLRLWCLTRGGMVVNFLSTATPKERQKPVHAYYSPDFGMKLAKDLGCTKFCIYADYLDNDWTLACYRNIP
jgi:SAM-dependent methyltransferase